MGFFKNLFEKLKGNKEIKDSVEKTVDEVAETVKEGVNEAIDQVKRDVILDRFR